MANNHHLAILKQGADVWNEWRQAHADIRPDLTAADLHHADLRGFNLIEADLTLADLSRANLSQADLSGALQRFGTGSRPAHDKRRV